MTRLSICIATFNRAAFLGQTLASILPQLTDQVELVVADGASTDETPAVVARYFQGRPDCRYLRLAQKGGVDRDYCLALAEARGDYCWLMTDDDLLLPGAVAAVLHHLADQPQLLVVNAQVAGPDLAETLLPRKLRLESDRDFAPPQQAQLLALAGDLLTFIGAVVIRRALWESRPVQPYLGTAFVHVGVIFQAPLPGTARVLARPLIRIRYGNAMWSPRAFEVWMFRWPELIWSFAHLPDSAKAAVCPREPWRRTGALLRMKARGAYTFAQYRAHLAGRPMGWVTRLRVRAIAAIPDTLANATLSLLLAILRPGARGTRLELRQSPFDFRRRWFTRRSASGPSANTG
jgi:hypothetical protein